MNYCSSTSVIATQYFCVTCVISAALWYRVLPQTPSENVSWLLVFDSASASAPSTNPLSGDLHHPNFPQRPRHQWWGGGGAVTLLWAGGELVQCPADWRALRCRFTVYVSHTGATAHLESTRARGWVREGDLRWKWGGGGWLWLKQV